MGKQRTIHIKCWSSNKKYEKVKKEKKDKKILEMMKECHSKQCVTQN